MICAALSQHARAYTAKNHPKIQQSGSEAAFWPMGAPPG